MEMVTDLCMVMCSLITNLYMVICSLVTNLYMVMCSLVTDLYMAMCSLVTDLYMAMCSLVTDLYMAMCSLVTDLYMVMCSLVTDLYMVMCSMVTNLYMVMCSLATCFCFMDMVLKDRLLRFRLRASLSSATVRSHRLDGISVRNPAASSISSLRNLGHKTLTDLGAAGTPAPSRRDCRYFYAVFLGEKIYLIIYIAPGHLCWSPYFKILSLVQLL